MLPESLDSSQRFQAAFAAQSLLGWQACLEGWVSVQWRQLQQHYLDRHSHLSRRSSRRWLTQLTLQFFNISWDLWEARNGILHRSGVNLRLIELRARIEREVSLGNTHNIPGIKRLLKSHDKILHSRSLAKMEQWLAAIKCYRDRKWTADELSTHLQQVLMRSRFLLQSTP